MRGLRLAKDVLVQQLDASGEEFDATRGVSWAVMQIVSLMTAGSSRSSLDIVCSGHTELVTEQQRSQEERKHLRPNASSARA